jgi:hypothetical protein
VRLTGIGIFLVVAAILQTVSAENPLRYDYADCQEIFGRNHGHGNATLFESGCCQASYLTYRDVDEAPGGVSSTCRANLPRIYQTRQNAWSQSSLHRPSISGYRPYKPASVTCAISPTWSSSMTRYYYFSRLPETRHSCASRPSTL